MKKNGFTLIELLAVIVILAIIALIATPIILGIIKDSKEESNKRSIEMYAKAIENANAKQQLDGSLGIIGKFDTSTLEDKLKIEYEGNVTCEVIEIYEEGNIYLSKCKVNGEVVKDSTTNDGYYHYGVYIPNYPVYKVGDCISEGTYVNYKDEKWCVVKDSSKRDDYVTLMKYIPLDFNQVWNYGKDDNGNFIMGKYGPSHGDYEGRYSYNGTTYSLGLARYNATETCGFLTGGKIESLVESGCDNNFDNSKMKMLLNNYRINKLGQNDLKKISDYEIRLITKEELENNLLLIGNSNTYDWVIEGASYWTMTKVNGTNNKVYVVDDGIIEETIYGGTYYYRYGYVRPVINLYKDAIS